MTTYTPNHRIDNCQCHDPIEAGSDLTLVGEIFPGNSDDTITEQDHCGVIVLCPHCGDKLILCANCTYARNFASRPLNYVRYEHRKHCSGINTSDGDADMDSNNVEGEVEMGAGSNDVISSPFHDDDMDNNVEEAGVDDDDATPMRFNHFNSVFPTTHSARFFYDQHRSGDKHGGARGVVYRCMNESKDGTEFANEDITKLYFDLFAVVFDLPESKQKLQMKFLQRLYAMNQPCLRSGECGVKIPLTHLELNQHLLRNTTSLAMQLPIERFVNVDDKHALISIDDTITLQMAHGSHPVGWLQTEDGIPCKEGVNGSPHAQRLLEKQRENIRNQGYNPDEVAIGWLSAWSDGFITSWVKQKEKGAWIFTVTISFPGDTENFEAYTHVVALGPSEADHDALINQALRDISKLSVVKRRYCGVKKKFILTSFILLVYSADRPERYKITYTTDGGTFHKCFGVATILDPNKLPSCERCFKSRVSQMTRDVLLPSEGNSICSLCCDWGVDTDTPESQVWKESAQVSKVFPSTSLRYPVTVDETVRHEVPECRPIPAAHIRPQRLTFELLIKCVAVAFYHVTLGQWGKLNARAYLKSIGIRVGEKKEGARNVLDMVVAAAATAKEEIKDIQDTNEKKQKVKSMMSAKELLRLKAIPELWYLALDLGILNMDSFIEIPMHHLFTGKS